MRTKVKAGIRVLFLIILFLGINLCGKFIADVMVLPLWLDSIGTCLAAYFTGPFSAAFVGAATNILYSGFFDLTTYVYSLVSVIIALSFYFCVRKGYLEHLTHAMISSFAVGVISVLISAPLNILFYDGYTGNVWGDGLIYMLRWYDIHDILSFFAGEAIVDIVDKQLCVFIVFILIKAVTLAKKYYSKFAATAVILIACIPLAFSVQTAKAVDLTVGDPVLTIYDSKNGMSASEANAIAQTDDGYIWIGSYAGLTRFDGSEFEFIREGGIVSVTAMLTDKEGRLWIGTNDMGVVCYDHGTYVFIKEEDGLSANAIRSFALHPDGTVYVGTTGRLCRIHTDFTVDTVEEPVEFVNSMLFRGEVLIGTTNQGNLFALDGKKLQILETPGEQFFFTCVGVTREGVFAGTTGDTIVRVRYFEKVLSLERKKNISPVEGITHIYTDSKQRVWLSGDTGICYLDRESDLREIHFDGFESSFACALEDYQGNMWFASSRYGVLKMSEGNFYNVFTIAKAPYAVVNAVAKKGSELICGTDSGLIILHENKRKTVENEMTAALAGTRVRDVMTDPDGGVWICTYGDSGLMYFDGKGESRSYTKDNSVLQNNRIRCIIPGNDGEYVVGTGTGVYLIDKEGNLRAVEDEELQGEQILSLYRDEDGTYYAGTDGSGIYYIRNDKIVGKATTENGLSSNIILKMVPYGKGLFCVTSNALCYLEAGKARRLTQFPYFNNYDIKLYGETAYVLSSAGIFELSAEDLMQDKNYTYKLYNHSTGLNAGLTVNSHSVMTDIGILYFCTNNGVMRWNTQKMIREPQYRFGLAQVLADDKPITGERNTFLIPDSTKKVSVKASVRNYSLSGVKVRFYVKEYDENPQVYTPDNLQPITLTNLPGGRYHVILQLLKDDEKTVLEEMNYLLEKDQQFFETRGYLIYLLLVGSWIVAFATWVMISIVMEFRKKKELEENKRVLEEKVREQTAQIVEKSEAMQKFQWSVIEGMASAIESRDDNTGLHVFHTRDYVEVLVKELRRREMFQDEIDAQFVQNMIRVAPLHDVGKIHVSDTILNKPGKFTPEEYEIMKTHTIYGDNIVEKILGDESDQSMKEMAKQVARYHHEHYNGKGYPEGLKGEEIPLCARIMCIADTFDALASKRVYKEAFATEDIFQIMEKGKGEDFDPEICQVFLEIKEDILKVLEEEKIKDAQKSLVEESRK